MSAANRSNPNLPTIGLKRAAGRRSFLMTDSVAARRARARFEQFISKLGRRKFGEMPPPVCVVALCAIAFDVLASEDQLLSYLQALPQLVARVNELMRLCDAIEENGRLEADQHKQLLDILLGTLTSSASREELAANWQRVAAHFDLLLDRSEAVDSLQQTIVQLAVRGLLVPQNSSDEPAERLLDQIRAADAQAPSRVEKRRVKTIEHIQAKAIPFEPPTGWAWARFGQIASVDSDLVPPSAFQSAWQVAPDCIEKGTGRLLHRRTVAAAEVTSPNHRFRPGQILYSKIRPSLSKAALVDFAGLCSADMYPINAKINSEFLLLCMLSRIFLEQVSAAENRVKMPKLNQEALASFLIPVPPVAEQSRIVARVNQLRRVCGDLREGLARRQTAHSRLSDALVDAVSAGSRSRGS